MATTKAAAGADAGSNATVQGPMLVLAWVVGLSASRYSFASPNASRVQAAVFTPTGALGESLDNLIFSFACVACVGLLDVVVARLAGPGRYFALHTLVNALIIAYVWRDTVYVLTCPNLYETNSCAHAGTPCANKLALDLTIAIHLWHAFAYALKPIDWIHHIPAYVVCAMGIVTPQGPVLNLSMFALMGLPGGLDYAMLTLIKLNLLHPRVEKDYNQSLNVWLRCPIAMLSAFIHFGGVYNHPEHFTGTGHKIMQLCVGLHHFWNGGFFMHRTVDARTRFVLKEKEKKEAAKKAA